MDMRKTTRLIMLLAFTLIGVSAAWADLVQGSLVVSPAPSNESFSPQTVWYAMKLKNTYFFSTNAVDDNSYLKASLTTYDNSDASLWCIVGNDTDGYTFYNKAAGTTKVLGITNNTDNTGGAARTSLVDASTEHSTTSGSTNISTKFDIRTNSSAGVFYVRSKGSTNWYFNYRSPYIAYWTDNSAYGNDGSQIYLYADVSDAYSAAAAQAKLTYDTYALVAGNPFALATDNEKFVAVNTAINTAVSSEDERATVATTISSAHDALKTEIKTNYIKPAADKLYTIRCAYDGVYLTPNYYAGTGLTHASSTNKKSVWKFEENKDGTFKIKNALSGYYITGTSSFTVNTSGTDYTLNSLDTYNGTCVIGVGTDYNANQYIHANGNPVIAWSAYAGYSRWYITEVSADDFKALAPSTADDVKDMLSMCVPSVLTESATALSNFASSPTSDDFMTILANSEKQDGMLVRIASAKSGNKVLALSSDYTTSYANSNSTKMTDVATLWKLIKASSTESAYYLQNMNTGTYLGTLIKATDNNTASSPMTEATSTASKFTITKKGTNTYNFIDASNQKMNDDGFVNYWTDGGNPGWYVYNATDIEVALNELGNKSYATVYLPVGVSAVSDATAYVAKQSPANNVLNVTSTEGFAANAGVVLVSDTKATKATLTIGDGTETSLLSGTNVPLTISTDDAASYLVFGPKKTDTSVVGFYKPSSSLTSIAANRAFYKNSTGDAISLNFNGTVTGIDNLLNTDKAGNAPVYDLSGRRVANAAKGGVYIRNGKKFMVK